jgi:hypothetical protein
MPHQELKKFAQWFHQDFEILFGSTEDGADKYLKALTAKQKKELLIDIEALLKEYPGKDHKGLKNAWLRLGAQWWHNQELPLLLEKLLKYGGVHEGGRT